MKKKTYVAPTSKAFPMWVEPVQRNFDFSASFSAYYLVNPNNLLTHTWRTRSKNEQHNVPTCAMHVTRLVKQNKRIFTI